MSYDSNKPQNKQPIPTTANNQQKPQQKGQQPLAGKNAPAGNGGQGNQWQKPQGGHGDNNSSNK